MTLEIVHREHEGIEILDLKGHLTIGQADLDFRNELDRFLKAGKVRVVLNLSGLRELDSTGLGTLLLALAELRKAGGNLAVFNMSPSHFELLTETKLEATLDVFKEEQDAINSFFPNREVQRYDLLEFLESNQMKQPR
jgi:anti-sigma B factor antagonist